MEQWEGSTTYLSVLVWFVTMTDAPAALYARISCCCGTKSVVKEATRASVWGLNQVKPNACVGPTYMREFASEI